MSQSVLFRCPHILLVDGFFQQDQSHIDRLTSNLIDALRRVEGEPLLASPFDRATLHKYFQSESGSGINGFPVTVSGVDDRDHINQTHYRLHPDGNGGSDGPDGEHDLPAFSTVPQFRRRLCKRNRPFRGLLIVLTPKNDLVSGVRTADRLNELLGPIRRGPVIDEYERLEDGDADSEDDSSTLPFALAAAQLVRSNGGSSVVICDAPPGNYTEPPQPKVHPAHRSVSYFTFHVVDDFEINEKLFGALTLRRKAGYSQAERRGAGDRLTIPRVWGDYGLDPDAEVRRLMEFEFSIHSTFEIFNRICCQASDEWVESNETTRYHRVLLAAVRLCKLLANKTLEGTPFNFTLFVPSAGTRAEWLHRCCTGTGLRSVDAQQPGREPTLFGDLNPVATLLNEFAKRKLRRNSTSMSTKKGKRDADTHCDPADWVWFNFDFEDEAKNHAELSQSPQLALLLDPETGLLTHILQKESVFTLDPLRFAQFENFFTGADETHYGVFLQGINGRVELHSRTRAGGEEESFCLEYNGSKWIAKPLEKLRECIARHYGQPVAPSRLEEELGQQLSRHFQKLSIGQRLEQAIATLLLQQKSSLILLCHDDEKDILRKLARTSFKPMRPQVTVTRSVQRINPVPLAGLLQSDGLHVIARSDGGAGSGKDDYELTHFASQFLGRGNVKEEETSGAVGSGTNVAYYLATQLQKSQIIKVSASGAVKLIQERR